MKDGLYIMLGMIRPHQHGGRAMIVASSADQGNSGILVKLAHDLGTFVEQAVRQGASLDGVEAYSGVFGDIGGGVFGDIAYSGLPNSRTLPVSGQPRPRGWAGTAEEAFFGGKE